MALNIKSDEAHRLASELAERRGTTMTEAVTAALGESLRATREPGTGVEALLSSVRTVQALVAELPDRDRRSPEEILGYDHAGLPA